MERVSLRPSLTLISPALLHISSDCYTMHVDTPATYLAYPYTCKEYPPSSQHIHCRHRQKKTNGIIKSRSRIVAVQFPEPVLGPFVQGILGFQHPEHDLGESCGEAVWTLGGQVMVTRLVYLCLSCC